MHILHLFLWSIVLVSCLGAPSKLLDARDNSLADLKISLGLMNLDKSDWHAYLVIHEPNEISEEGVNLRTYEYILSRRTKSIFFSPWGRKVKKSEIKATAKLLNPLHKTVTYEELIEAVGEIMENVKESAIPPVGEFQNCLDLAVEAVKLLWTAGYVTEKDYDAFKEVKDNIHADTRKASDDYTRKLIANRENTTYWQQLNKGT